MNALTAACSVGDSGVMAELFEAVLVSTRMSTLAR
jgi:hypothetical protein